MILTVRDIISNYTKGRLSARPEFYSGRDATLSDLNPQILEWMHEGILAEVGKDAASNFVKMVADIDNLAATRFLNALYALENHEWKWEKEMKKQSSIAIDNGMDAWGTVVSVMRGGGFDQTASIKNPFLKNHEDEYDHDHDTALCASPWGNFHDDLV